MLKRAASDDAAFVVSITADNASEDRDTLNVY